MTDTTTTSPSGTVEQTPMSFDAGVSAIENLIADDPETDLVGADEAEAGKGEASAEVADDDEPDLVIDDDEADEAAEGQTEVPSELSDDVVITLKDGEKISLGDLKRNNLFQRDYSRKTEELKQQREQLQSEFQERVSAAENEIRQRRDFILENWQRFIPSEPDPAMMDDKSDKFDPIGYLQAKQQYDDAIGRLNAMHGEREAEKASAAKKQEEEYNAFVAEQQRLFFEAMPKLKDDAKRAAFRQEAIDIGGRDYGITEQEVGSISDHRYMRILHDAIAYRKLVAKSQAAKQEIAAKPKLRQQQRMAPQAVQNRDRQGRFEAARTSGSIDAVAKSIEDLI